MGRFAWAEEEFEKLELVRHNPTQPDPAAFERIKGARALRGPQRDRIFTLHGWREGRAQSRDVPPFKILGNKALVSMAQEPPKDLKSLGKVEGVGPQAVRRWGRDLLRILHRPKSAPERVRPERAPAPEAAVRRRLKSVLAARDAKAEALGLQAGLLCPKVCAESVAANTPPCASMEDLAGAGLTGWRLEVLGSDFLTAIADA
jgi:ribonuclease D